MCPLLAATSAPRKRLLRKAGTAAAVRHHERDRHLLRSRTWPIPYLVMEYVAGRTLQQKLDMTGPLELHDVLRIGGQIAAGLAAAHAMGLDSPRHHWADLDTSSAGSTAARSSAPISTETASGGRQPPVFSAPDRGLTPPARPTRRSEVFVSSEVDMDKKVSPAPGSMPSSRVGTIPKIPTRILKRNEGFRERSTH